MDFDPVEAGLKREFCGGHIVLNDAGHLAGFEGARDLVVLLALLCVHAFTFDGDGGRGYGQFVAHYAGVRSATAEPELQEDAAAFGMHGGDGLLPGIGLLGGVNAGGVLPSVGALGYGCGLGDQQSGACPLAVVLGHDCGSEALRV